MTLVCIVEAQVGEAGSGNHCICLLLLQPKRTHIMVFWPLESHLLQELSDGSVHQYDGMHFRRWAKLH